jgi:flagellar hook assembly protein FlgD
LQPLEVELVFVGSESDRATAVLADEEGKTISQWNIPVKDHFAKIFWTGLDANGKGHKPGRYALHVIAADAAGNHGELVLKNAIVEQEDRLVDIKPEEYYFSPARGALKCIATVQKSDKSAEWLFRITDGTGKAIREMSGKGVPPSLTWDGKDRHGNVCRDGLYLCSLELRKHDVQLALSARKAFLIDSTPPRAGLLVRPKEFSPDGDYYNDSVVIVPDVEERSPIEKWEVAIYDENGEAVKKYAGKGTLPHSLRWGGRLRDGSLPFSMERFEAQLTVFDKAGNEGRSPRKSFSTGLLIIPAGRRQHIVFPHYGFRHTGKDERLARFLYLLAHTVKKLEPLKIQIEAHSDFEGDDAINLTNTEKAAAYAKDVLVGERVDEKFITFRGMGETKPLFGESAGRARRKNDRIEVVLDFSGE